MRGMNLCILIALVVPAATTGVRADAVSDCSQHYNVYVNSLPELTAVRGQCEAESNAHRNDPSLSEEELEAKLQSGCVAKQQFCLKVNPYDGADACTTAQAIDARYAAYRQALWGLREECEAQ